MTTAQDFVLTLIASAGFSAALSAAVVWLARTWLSERLRRSIQHEYDQKLAAFNAELRAESDTRVAFVQAAIDREADKLRCATASVGETQKAAIERKLSAIKTLWGAVLETGRYYGLLPRCALFFDGLSDCCESLSFAFRRIVAPRFCGVQE